MTVFQHYYTAWYDSARGSAGQQTKAQSPGIPFDLEFDPTWAALKEYALPPDITERDVQRHPVALRYLLMRPDLALLVHYTSTGTGAETEHVNSETRYGNMFVHTLALAPRDFVKGAPIEYWGSPFWQSEDAESTRHALAELLTFDVEPTLTLPQVVNFIQRQPGGWDTLMALLSAVVSNVCDPRPILIVDESDAVAHWIAGVSLLLPPPHRSLLSFSTYSHAYPSRYVITGLHPAQFAKVRVAQDYRDYFVLGGDPDDGKSEIAIHPYALFATQCLRDGAYERMLTPLFQIASQRFRAPETVADNLEALLSTRTLFAPDRTMPYAADEVSALSEFVNAEATKPVSDDGDLEFLRSLHTICLRAVVQNLAPIPFEPYQQSVSELVRRDASQWAQELVVDICSALDLLAEGATSRPQEIARTVKRICPGPEQTAVLAQQPQWAHALTAHSSISLPMHLRIWELLGRYITPEATPVAWLQATMNATFGDVGAGYAREQEILEELLRQRCSPFALAWAMRLRELRGQLDRKSTMYVEQFYYSCLVRNLWPPSERTPVRQVIRAVATNVCDTEAYEDLRNYSKKEGMHAGDVLDEWFSLAKQAPVRWAMVLDKLAALAQANASWISRALAAALLARIDGPTKIASSRAGLYLADAVIANIQFCKVSRDEELVCRAWYGDTELTALSRDYASAIVEARQGRATTRQVELLQKKLFAGIVTPQQYYQLCEQYLWQRFTSADITASHASDIQILYYHQWTDKFWKAYWLSLDQVLFDPTKEHLLMALLAFWFEYAKNALGSTGYTQPEFEQQLANHLDVCGAKHKSALTAVYVRLEKRGTPPWLVVGVLQPMKEALDKPRWPLESLWRR